MLINLDRNSNSFVTGLFLKGLYLLCFALPLVIPHWHSPLIILVAVTWILIINPKQLISSYRNYLILKLIGLLVLINLMGLFYSENVSFGIDFLVTQMSLLILPTILLSFDSEFPAKSISNFMVAFVAGVILLNLASLAFISYHLWDPKNLQSNLIIANNHIVQIHPAFLSLYISFCIFILVDQYFPLPTHNRGKLGWVLFSIVVLVVYLIWLNSRAGMLGFFGASLFYIFRRFRNNGRIFGFVALGIIALLVLVIPFSRERFVRAPLNLINYEKMENSRDPNIYPLMARKKIYSCNFELLKGNEFFYGYGTGDFRDVLQTCYQTRKYSSLMVKRLDSHNEYFAELHRHGIIGLSLMLAILISTFSFGIKYNSPLLCSFLILFAVTALFENVFSAQKGITFFALFCPLLILHAKQNSERRP